MLSRYFCIGPRLHWQQESVALNLARSVDAAHSGYTSQISLRRRQLFAFISTFMPKYTLSIVELDHPIKRPAVSLALLLGGLKQ